MVTVFCHSEVCMSGLTRWQQAKQASPVYNNQGAHPQQWLKENWINQCTDSQKNRKMTISEVAIQLQIHNVSAWLHLHKSMQNAFQNSQNSIKITVWLHVTTFWAILMRKVTIICVALPLVMKDGSTIICQIVITKIWNGNTQYPIKKKFKSEWTAGTLMTIHFWDFQRPILEHYQKWNLMMNSEQYSEKLCSKLKTEIKSTCWWQLSQGGVLLHDNAHHHI